MLPLPEARELPGKDGQPCGSSALTRCSDCQLGFCWGHAGNDRDYRCTPCERRHDAQSVESRSTPGRDRRLPFVGGRRRASAGR